MKRASLVQHGCLQLVSSYTLPMYSPQALTAFHAVCLDSLSTQVLEMLAVGAPAGAVSRKYCEARQHAASAVRTLAVDAKSAGELLSGGMVAKLSDLMGSRHAVFAESLTTRINQGCVGGPTGWREIRRGRWIDGKRVSRQHRA